MDQGDIGLIVLCVIAAVVSSVLHLYRRKDLYQTSAISGIISIVVFLIISHFVSGPEKFILIAFIIGGILSTVISLFVGILVRGVRKAIRR
jgi:uncharacterized membrane protein